MKLGSSAFQNGKSIPLKYTGDSINISPNLKISEIPEGTRSFVIVCEDPDSKKFSGKIWVHWILFNIPAVENEKNFEIEEGSVVGLRGTNDFGILDYKGPIPPIGSGKHRYFFKAYALSKMLELREGALLEDVEKKMSKLILDKAEIYGVYSRD